ncbi:MAG TPA: thrombospondin type 3 repeat-containing protein, partial [Bacteroidia bacterium]|nr:thrombospondin type 3 repeat-containing protein [Bacteroidia bacterium]
YHITFTDYLDNVKAGKNDSWMWYGVSVYYKFGKSDQEEETGPDMRAMMNEDFDKDGVADKDDQCQGTPAGVKVDHKGCPLDGDEDGVPDYLDKEPNTKKGAKVDVNGVTLDYAKIASDAERDSINDAQKTQFSSNPSQETLKQGNQDIQAKTGADCIPEEFRPADVNKDCVITADEINTVIDNYFDGIGNWTADGINRLIDYFFDQ